MILEQYVQALLATTTTIQIRDGEWKPGPNLIPIAIHNPKDICYIYAEITDKVLRTDVVKTGMHTWE